MIIANISRTKDAHFVTLTADITFRGKETQRVFFKTSKNYETYVANDASPFLAAVLLSCMKTRENIYIDGSVSQKLLQSIVPIMTHARKLKAGFYRVKIRSKTIIRDTNKPRHVGSFFTADIDSFYSYLTHKTKKDKITHFILPFGFSLSQDTKIPFAQVKKIVDKVAKEEKIKTIIVETNINTVATYQSTISLAHGGGYAAIALFLRRKLRLAIIPGGGEYNTNVLRGVPYELDDLWSTEKLSIKNSGGKYDQFHKINKVLSKSRLALKYLLVCRQTVKGKYNCSHCYDCLTTMIYLVCANSLKYAKTFEKTLDINVVNKIYYDYKSKQNMHGEIALTYLEKQRREPELQKAISYSLEKSKRPPIFNQVYQMLSYKTLTYREIFAERISFVAPKEMNKHPLIKLFTKTAPHR